MSPQNKTPYIEWLRLFAAAAVVLMHTAGSRWLSTPLTEPAWTAMTLWDGLVRWPVPIFMMITGALFLPRRTGMKTVLTRYIPRMAGAYLLWAAVYALHTGREFWPAVAAGHYHLWYLPYLCGVYLAMPFLQRIAADERLADQLLAVSAAVGLAVPWLTELWRFLWPAGSGIIQNVKVHLEFTFFLDCLALPLLGHRLHRTELTRKQRRICYLLGALGLLSTPAATVWASRTAGAASSLFFDFKAPGNLCAAAAIFVFAKYHLTKLPNWTAALARCSFGIYLLHPMVLERLADRGLHVLAWEPMVWAPVLAAAVFAVSAALSAVLSRIPGIGRYLI